MKLFLITVAVLCFSTTNAQSKKELKQYFEINKSIINQGNYELLAGRCFNIGDQTSWQDVPESPNYFRVKGDSVFVELHYKTKYNKIKTIKYEGAAYNKEVIESKKDIIAKLSTKQNANEGVQFSLTIDSGGTISLAVISFSPEFITLAFSGNFKKVE